MSIITEKYCAYCGVIKPTSEFYTYQGRCKSCFSAYQGARRAERRKDAELAAYDNSVKVAYNRKWQEKHRQHYDEYQRQYSINNRARTNAHKKKWQKAHPEVGVVCTHRRRNKVKENGGSYTLAEWRNLCSKYDHRCLCCGEQTKLTVDHIVPVHLGGSNSIENLQPLCQRCNSAKHLTVIDYRPSG